MMAINLLPVSVVAGQTQAQIIESAGNVVEKAMSDVLAAIKANRESLQQDPEKIKKLVNEMILPNFDFNKMSQWVLGKYWREATTDQQTSFIIQFQELLVRTYSRALLEYSNEKIKVAPIRAHEGDTEVTVRTEVSSASGFPIPINYNMYLNNKVEWKVYDVTIDGVSLVANYRNVFSSRIKQWGMDKLVTVLAEKNSQPWSKISSK